MTKLMSWTLVHEMNEMKVTRQICNSGVPQGGILGPHVFLLNANDLRKASNILDPIVFADDTNLLFTLQDIRYLFQMVN